jgi:hypothetical protein
LRLRSNKGARMKEGFKVTFLAAMKTAVEGRGFKG